MASRLIRNQLPSRVAGFDPRVLRFSVTINNAANKYRALAIAVRAWFFSSPDSGPVEPRHCRPINRVVCAVDAEAIYGFSNLVKEQNPLVP